MSEQAGLAVDATMRALVVKRLCDKLRDHYVFPEVAERMMAHIRQRHSDGVYDELTGAIALCEMLTDDMREISHDLHLRVRHSVEPRPLYSEESITSNPERFEEYRREAARRNFGVRRVERLAGNIGYLDITVLDDVSIAGDAVVAAMNLVAHSAALIFDLRHNGGGDPRTVALYLSYLFGHEAVHLNSFYWREDNQIEQFWTSPWVAGRRYGDKPVFALTGPRTFSGAEEFAYNLRQTGRGTLVGETTGGGAHPVKIMQLTPHFEAGIAFGRAINPISGTNWEGSGVEPHVSVPAGEALAVAHELALRAVLERLSEPATPDDHEQAVEAREALEQLA